MKQTLYQLYYYKKYGRLSTTQKVDVPPCVQKEITQLETVARRVCIGASPDAAAHTASSAKRTVKDVEVSASR
ncbi:hypothetical protein V7S43_000876 [Phytophthora oleae]|uniref:Uncharacterized protein n=1 Tax=Phytophthora oleae TaxID=2107226 RepID=A0ABD3G8J5_9STRA